MGHPASLLLAMALGSQRDEGPLGLLRAPRLAPSPSAASRGTGLLQAQGQTPSRGPPGSCRQLRGAGYLSSVLGLGKQGRLQEKTLARGCGETDRQFQRVSDGRVPFQSKFIPDIVWGIPTLIKKKLFI